MKILDIKIRLAFAGFVCLGGASLQAQQVDIKAATYGSDTVPAGTAPTSGVTSVLGTFTVTQIYVNTTATYAYNFISDASGVSNYIYFPTPAGTPNAFAVGSTYTGVSVTSAPFGTVPNLEFTVASGTTVPAATATGVTGMYSLVTEDSLTTTSVLSDNFTLATTTTPNDIEPVQFTFTPSAPKTVTPITGNYTDTDALNGDKINFYRPTNGLTFVTGQTYTIEGYAFAFGSGTEIYDPNIVSSVAAVPEPSSWTLAGLGALAVAFIGRRARFMRRT